MSGRYVVFGGCLGSGKTTLARLLAKRLGAETVMEEVDGHPLIGDFYKDPAAYSLQTEMIFVVMHYHQIRLGVSAGKFEGAVVSDLFFDGDDAYAGAALQGEDLKALKGLTADLRERLPRPDLVVFLQAPTRFLMRTSRLRGRDYEKAMTLEHLEKMNSAFDAFMEPYDAAPKVVVDAERMYELGHERATEELAKLVKGALSQLKS
ncbi:MAG: deoxynucleoside kinase [Nitrososphaerota archaeon]|jgi:deoxyadenosine/deoxycytidine kinase|nr:deoxynucleoside kinase [Nitrososphaerota archaeon]MDG6948940.1 deoxynucleoside kinase [Nitrososphaerota archaeon]